MTGMWRISLYSAGAVSGALAIAFLAGLALDRGKAENLSKVSPASIVSPGQVAMMPPAESAAPASGADDLQSESVVLGPGDTLIDALSNAGVSLGEAFTASDTLNSVFDPRDLKAGQRLSIAVKPDGENLDRQHLDRLAFIPETDNRVVVEHENDDAFVARIEPIEHDVRLARSFGTISQSFFESAREVGVPTPILMQAYRVLGQAVDFQRDLAEGDKFAFGYETYVDEGDVGTHAGNLVYISLDSTDKLLAYFRHETSDGFVSYFDEAGNSIASGLMKTPVSTGRLSSSYGKREHPVLGYTRMHKGLDFAAVRGTPVLAAGDGTIVQRRRNGSFGNYIRIRHNGELSTAYAHLDRYKDALASGDRVQRGEVIGYVGETGLTTGPNLHFEVLKGGRQVNPARVAAPPQRKLEGEALSRFQQETAEIKAMLDLSIPTENARGEPETDVRSRDKG